MKVLRSPLALIGGAVVAVLVVLAIFAPLIAPYDPNEPVGPSLERPSGNHLLGTNDVGQDIYSAVVWGARSSLVVGIGAASIAVAVGVLVGVGAALRGGRVDVLAARVTDVFLALPSLPFLVVVAALAGVNRALLVLLIAFISWAEIARLVRSQTLTLRARGFLLSSRGFGGGVLYVMRRHLVPALAPILVAGFVTLVGQAILLEAGLAFLGLAPATTVSWGLILNRALLLPGLYFSPMWVWLILPAGFAITLAVLGFTFLGVGLEPVLNPRWRRAR